MLGKGESEDKHSPLQRTIDKIKKRLDVLEQRALDTSASIPFATRKAPANRDRCGNGQYLVANYTGGVSNPQAHDLKRTPVLWAVMGQAVNSQTPKLTVTLVSATSISITTDITSSGVIVFVE